MTKRMPVKFKALRPDAVLPTYAKTGDAGLDITVTHVIEEDWDKITYGTGLAVEIPEGHVGLLFPRSSIRKYDLSLTNCVGVADAAFRGQLQATFRKTGHVKFYSPGERALQLIILPFPTIEPQWAEELSETERGSGGFGSTGA